MGRCRSGSSTVMPALVAGIHDLTTTASGEFVDARDKPGHDGWWFV